MDNIKQKNTIVSHETYFTAHELALIIIATDFCWNNLGCCSYCEDDCIHNVSSDMTAIALTMIQGGEY